MLSDRDLLGRLVAFDTTSHKSNRAMADFVRDYADQPGIRMHEQLSPDGEKVNLVLVTGPERDDREGLTLSGHMDVVPAVEPDWRSDPFTLTERDDNLYARGACDMKGFDALALNALLEANERKLEKPLVVLLTYDEEVGTIGARHFVEQAADDAQRLPKACIVGEPTSLEVARLHKGHTKMRITVRGVSAHSGYPHLGQNAIEGAARIVASLRGLRHRLEQEGGALAGYFPDAPFVSLNVGTIRGGSAVNIIPDECTMMIGFRLLPQMSRDEVIHRVVAACNHAAGDDPVEVTDEGESPPLFLDDSAPIYRSLCQRMEQEHTVSASYATDGGWLVRAGMDCAVWGPGSITVAHKPNEFMPMDEYARGRELLDSVVREYCG
ncbi:MAG: acetylornithine deacetylase [Planctomycetota bacterium]